jgi:exonuclease III
MKIATWNVERLKHHKHLDEIVQACMQYEADILVLTETDLRITLPYKYQFSTAPLPAPYYKGTERRVSVFTNLRCICQQSTYDEMTALCVELDTEKGPLLVYGTILGVFGNRKPPFKEDLPKQIEDFARLSATGKNLCVCGDLNCSFSDNYYFTTDSRAMLIQSFAKNDLRLLTANQHWCIDHIATTSSFVGDSDVTVSEWNLEKTLSDHKGIVVSF